MTTVSMANSVLSSIRVDEPSVLVQLTRREREVLALLIHRYTNKEIGAVLSISPRTVACHVAAILQKLAVQNRRDAAACAMRFGMFPLAPRSPGNR